MSFTELKDQAIRLPLDEQRQLIACLVAHLVAHLISHRISRTLVSPWLTAVTGRRNGRNFFGKIRVLGFHGLAHLATVADTCCC